MYTLDKLQRMSELIGNSHVEGELAEYLLSHMNDYSHMTLKKCMNDTGISKASIHRFYSSGGFSSFKELINVLMQEIEELNDFQGGYEKSMDEYLKQYQFDQNEINVLMKALFNANEILFYGKQNEMSCFHNTIMFLRQHHKRVSSLNIWNIETAYERIKSLNENDLLIIVDTSLKIQHLYEMSMNHHYLISLDQLKQYPFLKIYIGKSHNKQFNDFYNIRLSHQDETFMQIGLEILDRYIYFHLKEGINQ